MGTIGWGTPRLRMLAAVMTVPLPAMVAYADVLPANPAAAEHQFTYHQTNVLGTSLDMKLVAASQADADQCQQTILHEIERLRLVLSTYEPQSEISRLMTNSSAQAIPVSQDLHSVLADYQIWRTKSGGAYSAQLVELTDLWKAAQKKGLVPTGAELTPLLAKVHQSAYVTPLSENEVIWKSLQPLNIDSLGKGFIVERAAAAAKAKHPLVSGILLNIGGDITALGFSSAPGVTPPAPWEVKVADPQHPEENAPGLTTLHLNNKAVATSGSYERFYTIGDQKFSHILNPLTGRPSSNGVLQATVIAPDNPTANALATILCVVPQGEGIRLVEHTSGAAAMLVLSDSKQIRSKGFDVYETLSPAAAPVTPAPTPEATAKPPPPDPGKPPAGPTGAAWPKGYALSIDLNILPSLVKAAFIPYTCVWIEDSKGKPIKILAAWIGNKKYIATMKGFEPISKTATDFASTTRATRRAGQYSFVWDGTDAAGTAVGQGTYNLCVEVSYEKAGAQLQKLPVDCGAAKLKATLPATKHFDPANVVYGPSTGK